MAQGEVLGGGAATGEPGNVGVADAERSQQRRRVVGHVAHREALGRQW